MNRPTQHAFEPEEVMAYLDGELESQRAAALAEHLGHCRECEALAAQFRQVSERLLDFQVAPAPESLNIAALDAIDTAEHRAARVKFVDLKPRRRWTRVIGRPYAWAAACLAIFALGSIIFVGFRPTAPVNLAQPEISEYLGKLRPREPLPASASPNASVSQTGSGFTREQAQIDGAQE